jgi:hypothetical protein
LGLYSLALEKALLAQKEKILIQLERKRSLMLYSTSTSRLLHGLGAYSFSGLLCEPCGLCERKIFSFFVLAKNPTKGG